MNALNHVASSAFDWVLQTTWQAAVLAVLILVAQWLFRHRLSAGWRYGLWLLLVVRLLMPASPPASFSVFNFAKVEVPLTATERHPEAPIRDQVVSLNARQDESPFVSDSAVPVDPVEEQPAVGVPSVIPAESFGCKQLAPGIFRTGEVPTECF